MQHIELNQMTERHAMPDLTRAVALIGIAVVNVSIIAYPFMGAYIHGGLSVPIDRAFYFLVTAFCFMKFYPLFSFMFGVGFAYQMKSAQKQSAGFAARYFRRILGLLIFGFINIAFLFQGDILVLYAILGSVLFLFRNRSSRALMLWGFGFYLLQIVLLAALTLGIYLGQTYAPEDMAVELTSMTEAVLRSNAIFGDGTFKEAMSLRLTEWREIISVGIFIDGPGVMAFFLFGLAAVKSDIIADPANPLWSKFRRMFLPVGIVGSLIGAYLQIQGKTMLDPISLLGMTIMGIFALFLSAGYLGLIAKWATRPKTKITTFLARGGTASLTVYLLQGLCLSLIFNAYGLGLFSKLGAAYCILITLLVSVFNIALLSLWRKRFARGPFEYTLRKLTYFKQT